MVGIKQTNTEAEVAFALGNHFQASHHTYSIIIMNSRNFYQTLKQPVRLITGCLGLKKMTEIFT